MFLISLLYAIYFEPLYAKEVRLRLLKDQNTIQIEANKIDVNSLKLEDGPWTLKLENKEWRLYGKERQFRSKESHLDIDVSGKVEGLNVNGPLRFVKLGEKMDVIYSIEIEDYLLGVLPAEMPASWPLSALKAQAVAARTYALSTLEDTKNRHFDMEVTVMDQVYSKKKFLSLSSALQEKIRQAVKETSGQVLFKDEVYLRAFYHSQCGGHTENPRTVWNSKWTWQGRKDPYCNLRSSSVWSYKVNFNELAKGYQKFSGEPFSEIENIVLGRKNISGRIEEVFLFFKDERIRRWNTQDLRQAVGFSNIRSTRFDAYLGDEEIRFTGRGFGHGVGMCQVGAKNMASANKSYKEILSFYYSSAELKSLESGLVLQAKSSLDLQ